MNEKKINKPFTVMYEDFKKELADLINKSGLPALVIEPVLQNYLIETRNIAKRQYEADKAQYEQYLLSKKNEEKQD